jgi:hypothetical protein
MKNPRLNLNRIVSYVRFTGSCAFFAAAAALAFVVATPNVLSTQSVAPAKSGGPFISPLGHDKIGPEASEKARKNGLVLGPARAGAEELARHNYPGKNADLSLTINALTSFRQFVATSATPTPPPKGPPGRKSKKSPPEPPRFHTWSPVGPSNAQMPGILTFSGGPYTTSGRVTAMVLDTFNGCSPSFCRLWVGAAGGGVWRTTNALTGPTWTFLGSPGPTNGGVPSNAIGAITWFPPDTINFPQFPDGILYVGTGEGNQSADSEAGLGIYASTNGGDTWTMLPATIGPITTTSPAGGGTFSSNGTYTGNAFFSRSISSIVVDPTNPNILYVSSDRGFRNVDADSGAPTSNPTTPRPPFGVFKSTDGGQHFSFIWDGGNFCPNSCLGGDLSASVRGVHEVKLDPANPNTVYAAAFPGQNASSGGVYRSLNGGTTWTQIYIPIDSVDIYDRASFDVVILGNGNTRMYVGDGNDGADTAHVFRSDLVQTGGPAFTDLSAAEAPAGQSAGYCTSQCWYDNVVTASQEFPNVVYIGGSYDYNTCGFDTDCRAIIASNTSGASWVDWTWDAQDNGMPTGPYGQCCNPNQAPVVGPAPNQTHPDVHAIIAVPGTGANTIITGTDGGVLRNNGFLSNISGQCTTVRQPDGNITSLPLCQQMLSIVPNALVNMNVGLATLQFQVLTVAPDNGFHLTGGTQDNGTWDNTNGPFTWNQIDFGDGGWSGFNRNNSNIRFNSYTGQAHGGNFRNAIPDFTVLISLPMLLSPDGSYFYTPIIGDPHPAVGGTIFEGSQHVWRTPDNGGPQGTLEANCQIWQPFIFPPCGDFQPLGSANAAPNNSGDLTGTFFGGDRTGCCVSVMARTTTNTGTGWVATGPGRVFVTNNINTATPSSVLWSRVDADTGASKDPTRFPTDIAIDPTNPSGHAWISYSGYSQRTPTKPGHIFSVTWTGAGTATFTNISNNLPDIPLTSVVFDPITGDLYTASDFTVFRLAKGHTVWDIAGVGLPIVEVPHLAIAPGTGAPGTGLLYAGTHGLSAWSLPLYGR